MIKARASGSKVYLYFMKKGRQARHRIPRNSRFIYEQPCEHNVLRTAKARIRILVFSIELQTKVPGSVAQSVGHVTVNIFVSAQ